MLRLLRRLLGDRSYLVMNGKHWLAHRMTQEGRYQEALDLLEQAVVQRAQRNGPDHPRTRNVRLSMALALGNVGRNEEAKDALMPLLDTCVRLVGEKDEETLRCRLYLAKVFIDLGEYPASQEQLAAIFRAVGSRGSWWNTWAEERTKKYWRFVTSDGLPD